VFLAGGGEAGLPAEPLWLGVALTRGDDRGLWEPREAPALFYEMKGTAERLLAALGHTLETTQDSGQPYLHPGASCGIVLGKQRVGWLGELHPAVASTFEIDVPCALFELDLSAVGACPTQVRKYREVSRHPAVRRDLAVLLDRTQPAGELIEAIRKQAGVHLLSVEAFDRYEGEGVAPGKLSLAFRLVFQRADRTLTDAEVTKSIDRVVQMLAHRFGGELR
jgi:phenylalanyl-tRNA synthetase beta chain